MQTKLIKKLKVHVEYEVTPYSFTFQTIPLGLSGCISWDGVVEVDSFETRGKVQLSEYIELLKEIYNLAGEKMSSKCTDEFPL